MTLDQSMVDESGRWSHMTLNAAFMRFVGADEEQPVLVLAGRRSARHVSRVQLGRLASAYATPLIEAGVSTGDRVVLALTDPRSFLGAFWGIQLVGAVPVPLAPVRRSGDLERGVGRFVDMLRTAEPTAGYVDDEMSRYVTSCPTLAPADAPVPLESLPQPFVEQGSPALLQFTSGSSRNPRGCLHTHAGVIANMRQAQIQLDINHPMTGVNWCPLFHDLGLAGVGLLPVLTGCLTAVHQQTSEFLVNPLSWLRLIHEHRSEITSTSNAGMALVVRRLRRGLPDDLDLSTLRHVFDGAEPIDPDVVRDFLDLLRPTGLRASSIHPVYGMAENVAFVASSPGGLRCDVVERASLEKEGRAVPVDRPEVAEVSGGAVEVPVLGGDSPTVQIRVVDAEGRLVPDRVVGSIQLRSSSVLLEYFNDPAASTAVMDGAWLRTGDLGYLANGEIHLVGREKDLIIIGGRNYYAYDVERVVAELSPGPSAGVVAFGARRHGSDALVVVVEGKRRLAAEQSIEVRRRCLDQIGVAVNDVVVVKRGSLPRTTSGKVRRQFIRSLYEDERLERVDQG